MKKDRYIDNDNCINKSVNEYIRTHKKKDIMEDKEEGQEYDLVQAEIDLLKSKVYRILKSITEYKEV